MKQEFKEKLKSWYDEANAACSYITYSHGVRLLQDSKPLTEDNNFKVLHLILMLNETLEILEKKDALLRGPIFTCPEEQWHKEETEEALALKPSFLMEDK